MNVVCYVLYECYIYVSLFIISFYMQCLYSKTNLLTDNLFNKDDYTML